MAVDLLQPMLAAGGPSPYVTGGAAILGALVGGGMTGLATYKVEAQRQRHEREMRERADLAEARGLARVLFASLDSAAAQFRTERRDNVWLPLLTDFELPPDDRKVLFRHLTNDEFQAVRLGQEITKAIAHVRDRERQKEEELTAEELPAAYEQVAKQSDELVGAAKAALRRLVEGEPARP